MDIRRLGPHIDPPLANVPREMHALDVHIFQTILRAPTRLSREGVPDEEDRAAFLASRGDVWGIAHASLLTNLASQDPRLRNGSVSALAGDANLAAELGLAGVCFHVGYQKGHDSLDAALELAARKLGEAVAKLKPGARLLIENGAEGSELAKSPQEIARLLRGVGLPPDQIGIVLDTCHLHVSTMDLSSADAPERLAEELSELGLIPYLAALHLNDAQYPAGSGRDRHAPPGYGTINVGLLRLLENPVFAQLPCVLEMDVVDFQRGRDWIAARI